MLGNMSDHIDAATITPEAKPNSVFSKRAGMDLRIRNTKADPIVVPRKGISMAIITPVMAGEYYGWEMQ